MDESVRMVNGARKPAPADVSGWIGKRNFARWTGLAQFINTNYPGTFTIEWLYGGQKYGWVLRFKKSKSFCSMVPERGKFKVLLVFGAAEREKAGEIVRGLGSHVREDYETATTYHDGKWVLVTVDSAEVLADIKKLLILKRRPNVGRARGAKFGGVKEERGASKAAGPEGRGAKHDRLTPF
jgi:hypothetical protein